VLRRLLALSVLWLAACHREPLHSDTGSPPSPDTDAPDPDTDTDTDSPTDSDPPPDTDVPEPLCDREVPADVEVPADPMCLGEDLARPTDLDVAWSTPTYVTWGWTTGRSTDWDAVGGIDARDAMDIWANGAGLTRFEHDGTLVDQFLPTQSVSSAAVGDLDSGRVGTEVVTNGERDRASGGGYVSGLLDEGGPYDDAELEGNVWIADLEGDGAVEILVGSAICDADLDVIAWLEGHDAETGAVVITGDLDRDGMAEVIAGSSSGGLEVFDATGTRLAACAGAEGTWTAWTPAVGNLDADPDGEIVAAREGELVVCDASGSAIASGATDLVQPATIGVAQLDGDPEPEIVVNDPYALFVFEHDLTEKWRWSAMSSWAGYPFSLADLDGDGVHEIVVLAIDDLVVLDSEGAPILSEALGAPGGGMWAAPVVADVDADGRAEIVAGSANETMLFEDEHGGFYTRGAEIPWPGGGHFPGDRRADGSVPPPEAFWEVDNAWQGLPAGRPPVPDLDVTIVGVCEEACDAAVVTVRVDNVGAARVTDVEVALRDAGGVEIGRSTLAGPLDPGEGRHVVLEVAAVAVRDGLEALADPDDHVPECDDPAQARWDASSCP
jgi:hypothetical protein